LSDQTTYRQLYPYLRNDYDLQLVTGAPDGSNFPPVADLLPGSGPAWILPTGPQANILDNEATAKGQQVETFDFEGLATSSFYSFPVKNNVPTCSPLARFSGGIELLTYDIKPESGAVTISLFWRARSPQTQNLTVFRHLLNAEGELVINKDSVPRNGTAPVTKWPVDTVQLDSHRLEFPADLASGEYTITVGLYNDAQGRLVARNPAGRSFPNQSVPLETIVLP
jgi:hypothetical protein